VLDHLLQAVVDEPEAEDRWAVLADWLEEHDEPRRAELLRLHRRLIATCCEPENHPERDDWQAKIVSMLADGVKPCVPQRTILFGRQKIPMTFSWVPPGSFLMGSPPEEVRWKDERPHAVTLSQGFWLGTHLVTQAQWRWATQKRPSSFPGDKRPVENVSRVDCETFTARLAKKTGYRFRLPEEREWEWACRAGTTTAFFFGQAMTTDQANFDGIGISREQTTDVGSFPPNAWGLHDMHGNLWEWCSDWVRNYPMTHGGSWHVPMNDCRSAVRATWEANNRNATVGCRLVLCTN
jgi:uncharacterized protein (TIGR02996 family)